MFICIFFLICRVYERASRHALRPFQANTKTPPKASSSSQCHYLGCHCGTACCLSTRTTTTTTTFITTLIAAIVSLSNERRQLQWRKCQHITIRSRYNVDINSGNHRQCQCPESKQCSEVGRCVDWLRKSNRQKNRKNRNILRRSN